MDINIFEEIEHIWKKAKEYGFFDHILKINDFLFHPRKFWDNYNTLSNSEKVHQFICYSILFALVIWWSSKDITYPEIVRILIAELVVYFFFIIIIYFANVIVDCSLKRKKVNVIIYCFYVKLIVSIPFIVFIKLYNITESYFYLAIGIIFGFFMEVYLFLISAYAFQKKSKKVLFAFLLTVLLVNLYDCFFIFTGINGPRNSHFDDIITVERYDFKKSLNDVYGLPILVCFTASNDSVWYTYIDRTNDEAATFRDDNKYMSDLKEDIDSIDVIIKRCRYDSNRDYFKSLLCLKKKVLTAHEQKTYINNPIYSMSPLTDNDTIYFKKYNDEVQTFNIQLMIKFL